jgi:hypothetical protein
MTMPTSSFSSTAVSAIKEQFRDAAGAAAEYGQMLGEQAANTLREIEAMAAQHRAGLLSEAQRLEKSHQLWKDLAAGLGSELTGLREHLTLSPHQQALADKAIDAMQNVNTSFGVRSYFLLARNKT